MIPVSTANRQERGSATLATTGFLALLLLLGAALGVVAAMFHAHRAAQAAADLAALAAAGALSHGEDACGSGASVASANGADLLACSVEGLDVRVRVRVDGPGWLGQRGDLLAEARAGPVP